MKEEKYSEAAFWKIVYEMLVYNNKEARRLNRELKYLSEVLNNKVRHMERLEKDIN